MLNSVLLQEYDAADPTYCTVLFGVITPVDDGFSVTLAGGGLTVVPSDPTHRVLVVALSGALDFSNAEELRKDLQAVLTPEHRGLILDMTGLDFCDSTGIRILLAIRKLMQERGGAITLAGLNPRLTKIFKLTGLIHAFGVQTGFAEALDSIRARLPSN